MMGKLNDLEALGQAVWLDFVDRKFLEEGGLKKLVEEDGLTGVTSNPSIFEKAMGHGTAYDESLAEYDRAHPDAATIDRYEALAVEDIKAAADTLRPVYDRLDGKDGYVSLEVSPYLADDTDATIAEAAERTGLNLLGRLSGIATLTRAYVRLVEGTGATIVDTRKTTPGLRALEKYAVRCGGGVNHRFGLDDAILIKDNHVAACGGVGEAVRRARAHAGHLVKVEVEVDGLDQLDEALTHGPDVVMLDNFSLADLSEAVRRVAGRALLEASGGVTLETVRAIAETGVDVISVGALTHSASVLDIGLDAA